MPAITDPRLETFARHYALHRHGPNALTHAGFDDSTTHQALLASKHVKARVKELWGEALEGAEVTPQRVIQELARVAFGDIRKLYDREGNLLPVHEFDDDTAAAVVAIDVEVRWERDGDGAVPITTKKIRRADKMAALTILAKHVKVIGEADDGVNALASALADRLKNARRRAFDTPSDVEEARIIERPPVLTPAVTPAAVPQTQEIDDEVLW